MAVAGALGFLSHALAAQDGGRPDAPVKERSLVDTIPVKPSLVPAIDIALDPLGFAAPGAIYLGARNALVSLDFLDENRLLFTFRVPGLIHRDPKTGAGSDERRIRALVIALPTGAGNFQVEAEALWTVHDRSRYLWPLRDGHYLLRDRNQLLEGDAALRLKPYLDFPGSLLWIALDPTQQFMVTNSLEPEAAHKPSQADRSEAASEAGAGGEASDAAEEHSPPLVVRILRRDSGKVLLVSRANAVVHLPINATGYLENLRGQDVEWTLELNYFTGGSRMLGRVESTCDPGDSFVSDHEILVVGCNAEGASKLIAVTDEGRTLWITQAPDSEVWPQVSVAPNGSRMAWTTLDVSHSVNNFAPMDAEDVKEQSVTVFDAATGNIALVSPLSPIYDAGGNVAISPSGRRVALLNAGAIEVFDLPPVTPVQ